jgi:nucleoside 2-deoxyribosyltransferase
MQKLNNLFLNDYFMKAYIAGKLQTESERESLEKIDELCRSLGLKTFLPHRDVGLMKDVGDVEKIFNGDIINGFKGCNLVIALLDGLHVGAGTSWELGYAYAKGIPAIGIKTDESVEDAIEYLSAILIHSMPIVKSLKELENKIKEVLKEN